MKKPTTFPLDRLRREKIEATQDPATNVVIAQLLALEAELGDPSDVLNTERAQSEYYGTKQRIAMTITGLQPDAGYQRDLIRRGALGELLVLATDAEVAIKTELDGCPDWRTHASGADRDREWGHQQTLSASLKALSIGVNTENGSPGLPGPLRDRLTVACPHCENATLQWYASIPVLEARIADLDARIATRAAEIARHHAVAAELLGDTTSVTTSKA
jgi:hypothetical protein